MWIHYHWYSHAQTYFVHLLPAQRSNSQLAPNSYHSSLPFHHILTPNSHHSSSPFHHIQSIQMPDLLINMGNLYTSWRWRHERECVKSWIQSHYHRRMLSLQGVVSAHVRYILAFPFTCPWPWWWPIGIWGGTMSTARTTAHMSPLTSRTWLASTSPHIMYTWRTQGIGSGETQGTGTRGTRHTVLRLKDLVWAGKNFFYLFTVHILVLICFQYMFSHSHFC